MLVFSGFSSAVVFDSSWHQDFVEVEKGSTQELGDFVFSYHESGGESRLEFVHEDDSNRQILAQFTEDEIVMGEGNVSFVSDEFGAGFELRRIGYDEGLYLNLSVGSREDIFSESELSTSAPDNLIGRRNDDIQVPLTLENLGVANETYVLTTKNSSDLEVSYGYDSFNISEIQLDPGESQALDAVIQIPETARKGVHDVTFVARGGKSFTETVSVEVRGEEKDRRLELDIDQNFKSIRAGEQVKVPVTVVNRGEVELRDVNVTSTLPDGWESSIRPEVVDSLRKRYGRERVTVSITPPAGISPGDYFVEVSAHSDKIGVREPQEIRINVREKSGLAWTGVAVMAFSILLLIVVQRRFKRR